MLLINFIKTKQIENTFPKVKSFSEMCFFMEDKGTYLKKIKIEKTIN